jgi:hypothetical protein
MSARAGVLPSQPAHRSLQPSKASVDGWFHPQDQFSGDVERACQRPTTCGRGRSGDLPVGRHGSCPLVAGPRAAHGSVVVRVGSRDLSDPSQDATGGEGLAAKGVERRLVPRARRVKDDVGSSLPRRCGGRWRQPATAALDEQRIESRTARLPRPSTTPCRVGRVRAVPWWGSVRRHAHPPSSRRVLAPLR